jgi:hypothetical protein
MPYGCAKAVCATFCIDIAPALIPLFGPEFPSICTPKSDPNYGRMVIDRSIVAAATSEADSFREQYSIPSPSPTDDCVGSPDLKSPSVTCGTPSSFHRRFRSQHRTGRPHEGEFRLSRKRAYTESDYDRHISPFAPFGDRPLSPLTPRSLLPSPRFKAADWTPVNTPSPTPPPSAETGKGRTALPTFSHPGWTSANRKACRTNANIPLIPRSNPRTLLPDDYPERDHDHQPLRKRRTVVSRPKVSDDTPNDEHMDVDAETELDDGYVAGQSNNSSPRTAPSQAPATNVSELASEIHSDLEVMIANLLVQMRCSSPAMKATVPAVGYPSLAAVADGTELGSIQGTYERRYHKLARD